MRIFKAINVYFENGKLKREISRLETLLDATERTLVNRVNDYRELLGEREQLKEKIQKYDEQLFKIIVVCNRNDYGKDNSYKIKKILELAKFEDATSPSNNK